jgi:4-diphosphocytidyl-2-C-methyl-D-erythritol kinase
LSVLELQAPAKINLVLRILAQEMTGFHQLETLFAAVEFGDTLLLEPAPTGVELDTEGLLMGPVESNLAYRAATSFFQATGLPGGVRIGLKKRIPLGAGLGGGSSDAATVLMGLSELFPGQVDYAELLALAGSLGSDVPFFLSPSPLTLAWGRGDRLLPLPPLPRAPVLLALPSVPMSTPEAFGLLSQEREVEGHSRSPWAFPEGGASSWDEVALFAENDFEGVLFRLHPELGALRRALDETDPRFSLLSGSGSALYGLFRDEGSATTAKSTLESRFPGTVFVLTWTCG